ncbi:MAG: hypothetical protein U9O18_02580, partial [Chloroflexota bacterium]|nr:hypothetical protein [Chloroflexota bacterium]
ESEAFVVIANASAESLVMDVELPFGVSGAELVPLRGSAPGERAIVFEGGSLRVSLPARDGAVVRLAFG